MGLPGETPPIARTLETRTGSDIGRVRAGHLMRPLSARPGDTAIVSTHPCGEAAEVGQTAPATGGQV